MAENDNGDDNVIPLARYQVELDDGEPYIDADDVLEDCLGCFHKVVIAGINLDGEMEVVGNISNIAEVYSLLQDTATHMASSILHDVFSPEGSA